MTSPAELAATVREALTRLKLEADALPLGDMRTAWRDDIATVSTALDALQAQAEEAQEWWDDAIEWQKRAEAAEAERDRLAARVEQLASIMNPPYDEYEKLAARIEELEAALTNLRNKAHRNGVWWLENECRAALNKETA